MKHVPGMIAALVMAMPVGAAELGDDGLHKTDWMRETFKDLREDLAEAGAEGKRLMLIVEQRGCIYCTRMHEEVFPRPGIADYIRENYFVVQINLHGDIEVTDFDGESLSEKAGHAQVGAAVHAVDPVPARGGAGGAERGRGGGGDDARRVRGGDHAGPADMGEREAVSA